MTATNGNTPFTHTDKTPGDVIRSEDWNAAMTEVMRLNTDKVNRQGADTIQGPLTIEAAFTINDNVGIGTAPTTERLKVEGDTAITGPLSVSETLSVTQMSQLTGNVGIGTKPTDEEQLRVQGEAVITENLWLGKTRGGGSKLLLTSAENTHFIRANKWWTEFVSNPNEGWRFMSARDTDETPTWLTDKSYLKAAEQLVAR